MPESVKYPIRVVCVRLQSDIREIMGDLPHDSGRRTSKDIADLVNTVAETYDLLFSQITMPIMDDLKEP